MKLLVMKIERIEWFTEINPDKGTETEGVDYTIDWEHVYRN